ncbi:hypothetical protein LEP1GSC158_1617 [Leptospira interrogans serovar Zanoni str. LT2156]|uniref:Uncharacterized protein n=1 Tax=Leptospira interrogans serovar Zanoni str. LT2156 TaxID=1001601 RepID=M6HCA2_LEPIR|nr:hypothetical protein LEP1GSC158_1617 [Leptospira interrogans serovar Zanoni str. LT2156]
MNTIANKPAAKTAGVIRPIRQKYEIVLSSECSSLSANSSSQKVLSVKNDRSKPIRVTAICIVYKTGLEDCIVDVKRSGSNGEVVTGQTQISVVGRDRSKDRTADFPVDFILNDTLEIELHVKTKAVALVAGDICLSLLGEYV